MSLDRGGAGAAELRPGRSLERLSALLRDEHSPISPLVAEPSHGQAEPALGLLAARARRDRAQRDELELVVEAIREGYLLHYARPRLVAGAEPDLALLAGDYLYALGLERLAELGDRAAVAELSELIALLAQLHAGDGTSGAEPAADQASAALWLSSGLAAAAGTTPAHERAKALLRAGEPAAAALRAAAEERAAGLGLSAALGEAAAAIHLAAEADSASPGQRRRA